MDTALARRGAGVTPEADLRRQTRDAAEHLQHLAGLALASVDGEEPEVGTDHILDGLDELAPHLEALRRARAGFPS